MDALTGVPEPHGSGTINLEPFCAYRQRWPNEYSSIPDLVIETWIYRHWRDFQQWAPVCPLKWEYRLRRMRNSEIMMIKHVGNWNETLCHWGDDLLARGQRSATWLGRYMLEQGTSPTPIIVAENAGAWPHPREHGVLMCEPYQIIEGHLRLSYLQALVRAGHPVLQASHDVFVATLPPNNAAQATCEDARA